MRPRADRWTGPRTSRRAAVSLPTAHRRAADLVAWGALERTSPGRYRIGLRLWEIFVERIAGRGTVPVVTRVGVPE